MPSITSYGGAGSGYTNNGTWSATDQVNAGHWYLKGPMDYIAWWPWALNLPSNATIQSASWVPNNPTVQTPENATWYLYDTNGAQGGAIGTLFVGGYTGGSVDVSRVNAYKTGTMWARYQNSLNGSGSNTSAYVQLSVTSTYITVNYITNTAPTTSLSNYNGSVGSPTVATVASPTLTATFTDPDAGTVRTWYELWNDVTNTLVSSGYGASFTGPISGSARNFPVGPLTNGVRYRWRSWTDDPTGASNYSTWGYFQVNLNQTVTVNVETTSNMVTSDNFTRPDQNLVGTKTDAGVGGSAGYPWTAASLTAGNNNTNGKIVGGVVKRSVAEPLNVAIEKAIPGTVAAGIRITEMPTGSDTIQLFLKGDSLAAGAVPQNCVRAVLQADGSVSISRIIAGAATVVYTSAAGAIGVGDDIQVNMTPTYLAVYKYAGGVTYSLLGGGAIASAPTGSFYGVRFNGTGSTTGSFDRFYLFEVGTIATNERVMAPTVAPGVAPAIQPAGIATGEAAPVPVVNSNIGVSPPSIGSAEALGVPLAFLGWTLVVTPIESSEAFGGALVAPGGVFVLPGPIQGPGATMRDYFADATEWTNLEGNGTFEIENETLLVETTDGASTSTILLPEYRLPIRPGGRVDIEVMARSRDSVNDTRIGARYYDALGNVIGTALADMIETPTNAWVLHQATFFAPPTSAKVTPVLISATTGGDPGDGFYFENLYVESVDEQFGYPVVRSVTTHAAQAIPSAEAWGQPNLLRGPVVLEAMMIDSGQVVPVPGLIRGTVFPSPAGIVSGEAFGATVLQARINVLPNGIASVEVVPVQVVVPGNVNLGASGIASAEAFGFPGVPLPGVPWLDDTAFYLSMRTARPYYLVLRPTASSIRILNNNNPIEVREGE